MRRIVPGLVFVVFVAWASFARADDVLVRTELPLKMPRSREPVLGGSKDKVFVQVWMPEGVKRVRAGVCNPFSKDEPPGKHWKAFARLNQVALIAVDFDAVRKEEYRLLQTGLEELATKSGHPELATMPLGFTGMSRGGGMSMQLAELMPERTFACVPVCLEVGPTSEATRQIPVATVFGEKDGKQMSLLLDRLPKQRAEGARWAIAVQWGRGHEFALANNLGFVWFDDALRLRVPSDVKETKLASLPIDSGWLASPGDWKKSPPAISSSGDFEGDRTQAAWFPTKRSAAVWQAFVSPDAKLVKIAEPAGLGDGQPFRPHAADQPINVTAAIDAKIQPSAVQLWDADRKLGEKKEGPWNFEVRLPRGIHSLIVVAIDGENLARRSRPHTIVVE